MSCELLTRYVDAYVDEELDVGTQLEVERHLSSCEACREHAAFVQAMKGHVREAVREAKAPPLLAERIRKSLDTVQQEGRPAPLVHIAPMRLRHAIPLAGAAAVLMAASYYLAPAATSGPAAAGVVGASSAALLEDVVRVHASDLPADVPGEKPQEVTRWFRNKVSFPVRPASFARRDARLLGARLSNVRERRAAALYYDVGGERVTVMVFDEPAADRAAALRRTRFEGREVFYRQVGAHTVPVRRQSGVTYAFTGDLDRQSLLRLAATARVTH